MDWHLIYRDDRQMRAIADSLPTSSVTSLRQFHDPLGAITIRTFLLIAFLLYVIPLWELRYQWRSTV